MKDSELKKLRKKLELTQKEASLLLGVSLRTYIEYENNPEKAKGIKYNYLITTLSQKSIIDEEHGILKLSEIFETASKIFDRYDVNFCYLFGSYAKGLATDQSDIDFLIDTTTTGLHFFGLIEELREKLHKKIDLLDLRQLNNNLDLTKEILQDGIRFYGKSKKQQISN